MISGTLRLFMLFAIVIYYALLVLLLKKKSLNLKYSLLWFGAGLLMLLLAIFPGILSAFASAVGIMLPVNALFALMFFCVIILLVSLTSIVSKQNETIKKMIQQQALLEERLRVLETKTEEVKAGETKTAESKTDGKETEE